MFDEEYLEFVSRLYDHEFKGGVRNNSLNRYFERAFQFVIDKYGLYPAWACINCLKNDNPTNGWGGKPTKCSKCGTKSTFLIANFQSRAPRFGKVFVVALRHLVENHYDLFLRPTPGNTKTHDLEVTPKVAIELKGSARRIVSPDGSIQRNRMAGMLRSDTDKKAFDNARTFMTSNPDGTFFILTNALPSRRVGHRGDGVAGIFDVTKKERLDSFVREARDAS